jgi:hypothetical protein
MSKWQPKVIRYGRAITTGRRLALDAVPEGQRSGDNYDARDARNRSCQPKIVNLAHIEIVDHGFEIGLFARVQLPPEVKYLTWTDDNLLRQVVYEGLREDKPAIEVRRPGAVSKTLRD